MYVLFIQNYYNDQISKIVNIQTFQLGTVYGNNSQL